MILGGRTGPRSQVGRWCRDFDRGPDSRHVDYYVGEGNGS
jgi:hypothetical protein